MPVRIVLSRPSHPGNIGAAARAMKTMGFTDLALVQPRHFPDPDAVAMAAGAAELLTTARVTATLEAALADCTLAAGFSARGRDLSHPAEPLREAAPGLVQAASEGRVALVFGNETSGLSNEELLRCQRLVHIPANPQYASLNLAAAVQVACYELATAAKAHATPAGAGGDAATGEDVHGLFAHLESAVHASGYVDPENPGRFMERMRRLFARGGLERTEVRLLRGMLAAFEKKMRR
ncbi:MAG TPA: RNA methyltransferase [Usitatibacter sp.]|nr:RNA methyltransferase [Usitatibacter sp.]